MIGSKRLEPRSADGLGGAGVFLLLALGWLLNVLSHPRAVDGQPQTRNAVHMTGSSDLDAGRLSFRSGSPTSAALDSGDKAPGEHHKEDVDVGKGVRSYLIGLALAALLTAGSFYLSYTDLVYGPGVAVALLVFAIAQMGIHLVFFLHLTTSPDNINNTMALMFGLLIVFLLIGGTSWIMYHMNHNMMNT